MATHGQKQALREIRRFVHSQYANLMVDPSYAYSDQSKKTKIMNEARPPVSTIDSPIRGDSTSPDRLGRQGLAKAAADVLLKDNAGIGFAMSIEGAWGSGKTSFCNLIKRELGQVSGSSAPIVIDFNPWMFGTREQLTKAFLKSLASKLSLPDTEKSVKKGTKLVKGISKFAKVLKVFRLGDEISKTLDEVHSAMDDYANALEQMSKSSSFELERQKGKVSAALQKLKRPIVVFVDDIDRLVPEEIFEMIRLIKAVGDLPYLRYVVPYDAEYVVSALGRYDIHNADGYLQKIFQFRFPLPPCDKESLREILTEALNQLPEEQRMYADKETNELYSLTYGFGLRELIETPRDITRAFASVEIKALRCKGEVSLPEIIALEFVAIKAPDVYRQIIKHPELWTGSSGSSMTKSSEEQKEKDFELRNIAYVGLLLPISEAVKELTSFIFPHTAPKKRYSMHNQTRLGLSQPDRLRFYINIGLPVGEVSKDDVHQAFMDPIKLEEIAKDHFANQRHGRFFSLLAAETRSTNCPETALLLKSLDPLLGDKRLFAKWDEEPDIFGRSARDHVYSIVENVISHAATDDRQKLIRSSLDGEFGLEVSRFMALKLQEIKQDLQSSPAMPQDAAWGNSVEIDEQLKNWANLWCLKLPPMIKAGEVMIGGLSMLIRLADDTVVKKFMTNFIEAEHLDFLTPIIAHGGNINGNRYAYVKPDLLEKLNGQAWWKGVATERMKSTDIAPSLRHSYKAISEDKKIYLDSGEDCAS
jgi:KAP family P-loop domain